MGLIKALFYCLMRANTHIMREMKSKKLFNILKALGAFILLLSVCFSGALFFHTYYYEAIYVSGNSMSPTLTGGEKEAAGTKVDFGIVDPHQSALKHIKRFDIVSTYYPDEMDYDLTTNKLKSDARKKIKRVIALPNETFKIEKGKLYILKDTRFEYVSYTFKTDPAVEDEYTGKDTVSPITLKDDEYWVLGDHRSASRDCNSIGKPIKQENLYGVLVAIEGTGTLYIKEYVCDYCGNKGKADGGNVCQRCFSDFRAVYDVKNKHYHWPKFY